MFPDINLARVSDTFVKPELATDFLENDAIKLGRLFQEGIASFAKFEQIIRKVVM